MRKYLILLFLLILTLEVNSQGVWVHSTSPTTSKLERLFFLDEMTGWAAGDSGRIFKTTDGTQTWTQQPTGSVNNIYEINFLNENTGWALAWIIDLNVFPNYGTELLITTNSGELWESRLFEEPDLWLKTVYFKDDQKFYLGGYPGQFLESSDAGNTWSTVVVDSSVFAYFPVINMEFYNENLGFASGGYIDIAGVIWKTTNGGTTWVAQAVGPEPIQDFKIFDSLNIIGVGGDFEYGTGVVRSTDGGDTWEYESLEILGTAYSVSFRNEVDGWMCLGWAGVMMYTRDRGETWEPYYTIDSAQIYQIQFLNDSVGYGVGVDGAVIRFSRDPSNIEQSGNSIVTDFRLYQNYPNPFNPTTVIKYYLPEFANVSVTVYDLSGKEILTLDNGSKNPGNHLVSFNGRDLSSGVYIYTLNAEGRTTTFSDSKKMILLK